MKVFIVWYRLVPGGPARLWGVYGNAESAEKMRYEAKTDYCYPDAFITEETVLP